MLLPSSIEIGSPTLGNISGIVSPAAFVLAFLQLALCCLETQYVHAVSVRLGCT